MRRAPFTRVAAALLALFVGRTALAQPDPTPPSADTPAPTAEEQAEADFRAGREALKAGDPKRALELFQSSHARVKSPVTLLNIAVCEEQLGALASALGHVREVERQLPADDALMPIVRDKIGALGGRMPTLRLDLAVDAPEGARVWLDDQPIGLAQLGVELPLDPGAHLLRLTAPGRADAALEVTLAEGEHATRVLEPGPVTSAPPPPPAPNEGFRPTPAQIAGLSLGGLGVLALGIGTGTGIAALGKKSDVDTLCPDPDQCTEEGVSIAEEGEALSVGSTVCFAIGLAALGGGAALYFTQGADASVALVPLPTGAALGGRF